MDPGAIGAGFDIVKRLGADAARQLLAVLELPDDARWASASSMFERAERLPLADILADVEEDLTGSSRERLIIGLRAALD